MARQNSMALSPEMLANAGKGRPKGVPNKNTAALKDMILKALDAAGGVQYLTEQADKNPAAFMTLVGKVLPMTVAGDPDNPLQTTLTLDLSSLTDEQKRVIASVKLPGE